MKLSEQKNNIRYYLTAIGTLVELEQNPCGCHPFDILITYTNLKHYGKGKSYSQRFENQKQIKNYCRRWKLLK